MSSQMTGQRYYVERWMPGWGVFDEAELCGDPLSKHTDEIDAIAACAKRNAAHREKMGPKT